ncbi:hypothetical protein V8E53_002194 [Lactarius tabidus]
MSRIAPNTSPCYTRAHKEERVQRAPSLSSEAGASGEPYVPFPRSPFLTPASEAGSERVRLCIRVAGRRRRELVRRHRRGGLVGYAKLNTVRREGLPELGEEEGVAPRRPSTNLSTRPSMSMTS